jgi:hypothetical protein
MDSEHSDRVLLRIPKVNDKRDDTSASTKTTSAMGEAEGMAHTGFSQAIREKYFGKPIYQVLTPECLSDRIADFC